MNWFTKKLRDFLTPVLSAGYRFIQSQMTQRGASPEDLIKRNSSWVYIAASMNARTVAQVPLRVYAKGGNPERLRAYGGRKPSAFTLDYMARQKIISNSADADDITELPEHPLALLLAEPNGFHSQMELLELTDLYEELLGNAYWYVEKDALGTPVKLVPLMAQWVFPVPDPTMYVRGYLYGRNSATRVPLAADEVVHYRFPNVSHPILGRGPLEAVLRAVDRSTAQAEYDQAMWDNNARPDFIINVPEGTKGAERDKLYAEWKRRFKGRQKAGQPVILQGDMDVKPLSFSPKDTAMFLIAKLTRQEILVAFGPTEAMFEANKSRAEDESKEVAYMRRTIVPRLHRLEQQLKKLCRMFDPSGRLFVMFDECVPRDRVLLLKERTEYTKAKIMSINEVREEMGLDPVPWGDEPPAVPAPLAPGGQADGDDDEEDDAGKAGPFLLSQAYEGAAGTADAPRGANHAGL